MALAPEGNLHGLWLGQNPRAQPTRLCSEGKAVLHRPARGRTRAEAEIGGRVRGLGRQMTERNATTCAACAPQAALRRAVAAVIRTTLPILSPVRVWQLGSEGQQEG
jgi:hypothetical protein